MSYIVFARKYRPQTFDEIVGQSHIATTLKNAISQGRVAHAYIFSGPRGVGKTTTARILAKALNCEKGPAKEPCNLCASCNEITQGSSIDILEIDGASNRGIDEIKNLRENIKFAPSRGAFKIYIIDEVHMLTSEAFNALLKTLEEPPPHVKFIFATTQANKVPPTILSRCQRFDFRRIAAKDIFGSLKAIAKVEKLAVKDDALALIAKHADGSMRDGQVILDQIMSFTKGSVEAEDIVKMLGIVDEEILFGLSGAIKNKDALTALKIIGKMVNEGKDILQLTTNLIEHFRNIAVVKISKDLDSLIEIGPDKMKRYEDEAKKHTIEEILYITYTLSNAIDMIRRSSLASVPLEIAVIKLTRAGSITSLTEILDKINKLGRPAPKEIRETCEARPKAQEEPATQSLAAPETTASPEMEEILSSWNNIINRIKAKKISIGSYLDEGYPISLSDKTISIGFPNTHQFHKEVLETVENKRLIEEAIKDAMKLELKVSFTLVEPVKMQNHAVKDNENDAKGNEPSIDNIPDNNEQPDKDVDPIIKSAIDIFGAKVLGENKEKGRSR